MVHKHRRLKRSALNRLPRGMVDKLMWHLYSRSDPIANGNDLARMVRRTTKSIANPTGARYAADEVRKSRARKWLDVLSEYEFSPASKKDSAGQHRGNLIRDKSTNSRIRAYLVEINRLRPRLHDLFHLRAKAIALQRLKMLKKVAPTYFQQAFSGRLESGIPQRYENIARVMSEFKKPSMFAGKEALLGGHFVPERRSAPVRRAYHETSNASELANWSHASYNCRLFVNPTYFQHEKQWGHADWGEIGKGPNAILAIQVFDPSPKKLLELAKNMAKRRPNDPIPILDLYGNVFFP